MTVNLTDEYIELTKKQITDYLRLVFGNKFIRKYCDIYIKKYIDIRYYNFYDYDTSRTLRKKILDYLRDTAKELCIDNIEDRVVIDQMCVFFYYVLYFDKVTYFKDIRKTIEKIAKLRKRILEKEDGDFEKNLYVSVRDYKIQKEKLLETLDSDEFFIKLTNYPQKINVYRVNLKYNLKFPQVYSEFAINKAFNVGLVNEDKLLIEYYLTTKRVLEDVLKQNFTRQYVLEFTDKLLSKPNKLKNLLNIINNMAIKDKVSLKIKYESFIKEKEKIYDLMRDGYKITIILDNSFEINYKNIESLSVFKYVIVNRDLKNYNEIINYKKRIKNIIEI